MMPHHLAVRVHVWVSASRDQSCSHGAKTRTATSLLVVRLMLNKNWVCGCEA